MAEKAGRVERGVHRCFYDGRREREIRGEMTELTAAISFLHGNQYLFVL